MTAPNAGEVSKGEATMSTEGRRIIGQAIMDGILMPREAVAVQLDYTQHGGNYIQRGGGNYTQDGGGNYDQAPLTLKE